MMLTKYPYRSIIEPNLLEDDLKSFGKLLCLLILKLTKTGEFYEFSFMSTVGGNNLVLLEETVSRLKEPGSDENQLEEEDTTIHNLVTLSILILLFL